MAKTMSSKILVAVLTAVLTAVLLLAVPLSAVAQFSTSFQFMQALKKKDYYELKSNVLKGANVNARDDDGTPALVLAAGLGEAGIVRFLIEQGAHVDGAGQKTKETALMRAAGNGDKFSTAVLLYFGADPNMSDKLGQTALIKAVRTGNIEVIELLTKAKADLHAEDNTGHTALDYAQRGRRNAIVDILKDAGAEY